MIEKKEDLELFVDKYFVKRRSIKRVPKQLSKLNSGDIYNKDGKNPMLVAILRGDSATNYSGNAEKFEEISNDTDSPLIFLKMTSSTTIPFMLFDYIENWIGCFDKFSRVVGDKSDMVTYYEKSIESLRNFPMTTMLSTENLGKVATNMLDVGVLTPRSMRNRDMLCRGGASDWAKRLNGSSSDHRMWVEKSIK